MLEQAVKEIKEFLKCDLTDYRIAKDSGLPLAMIQNYRNGKRSVDNMTLKTAVILHKYIQSVKKSK